MLLKRSDQSIDQKMWEFDFWVTPSIVDIRGTDRFKLEMKRVVWVLDALTNGGHQELDTTRFSANLVERVFVRLNQFEPAAEPTQLAELAEEFLASLSALLFLVTGKSDNNNKCQFPIYLRNQVGWETIPILRTKAGKPFAIQSEIPRVLDSEAYMSRIARMYVAEKHEESHASLKDVASTLLFQFVNSLLTDEPSRNQLTAFLNHYKKSTEAKEDASVLLTPLVMFQVRGSVAASGGHEPEELLRVQMTNWGMIQEIDFNINDVILDVEAGKILELRGDVSEEKKVKTKTRAYDFVLPFRTPNWHPMIFVQSQFYAGDSGSVSHKNVDQTISSRQNATRLSKKAWPKSAPPIFLEYVDGAGYSASLNGDLKSLLSFQDTAGFFQVRSASIRLRRELQKIGFLTPFEIAHAVVRKTGKKADVVALLTNEGYSAAEIERTILVSITQGLVVLRGGNLIVASGFMPAVRRHLILDLIACEGSKYLTLNGVTGVALVPGYGPLHGLPLSKLEILLLKSFKSIWPAGFMADLQQLCTDGLVVLR